MEIISENLTFGGVQGVYRHASTATGGDMTFAVYLPAVGDGEKVPCLWFLSGLTCTHENAMIKAGAQAYAAKHGLALVFPDTSPRGETVADDDAFDLGKGAGFYVDACQAPWASHYQMETYITQELQSLILKEFSIDPERQGITGHSMGGHGAITLALRHPELYQSLSAFAPIANPTDSDWGRKQFAAYLGGDEKVWAQHDASILIGQGGWDRGLLVDQGTDDEFLDLLRPDALVEAMARARTAGTFRLQPGYDHSYYFIATFMADHIAWHAKNLS